MDMVSQATGSCCARCAASSRAEYSRTTAHATLHAIERPILPQDAAGQARCPARDHRIQRPCMPFGFVTWQRRSAVHFQCCPGPPVAGSGQAPRLRIPLCGMHKGLEFGALDVRTVNVRASIEGGNPFVLPTWRVRVLHFNPVCRARLSVSFRSMCVSRERLMHGRLRQRKFSSRRVQTTRRPAEQRRRAALGPNLGDRTWRPIH